MQATIMRTTTSPSSMSTPVSKYGGGKYPQWMRTLEEKYQKLHQKITNNTVVSARYPSLSGRTVYDVRVAKALAKYRDISRVKPNVRNVSVVTDNSTEANKPTAVTSDENENNVKEEGECLNKNKRSVSPTGNGGIDVVQTEIQEFFRRQEEIDNQSTGELEPGEECGSQEIDDDKSDKSDNSDKSDADKPRSPSPRDPDMAVRNYSRTGCDIVRPPRRHVTTSLSRTSRNTSRSCPAKIQSKIGAGGGGAGEDSATAAPRNKKTGRSANKSTEREKMFNKMSMEAQFAITETIQEMNLSRSRTTVHGQSETNVKFIPSRTRRCVKSWAQHSSKDERNKRSKLTTNELIEQTSKSKREVSTGNPIPSFTEKLTPQGLTVYDNEGQDFNSLSSHGSLSDIESSAHAGRTISRLPNIQSESRDVAPVKSKHFRIPGIGKYDIRVNDATFEITPPGFDSRYTDLEPIEDRESETPPPDIRQRAIDKCSEWLTKYGHR